MDPTRRQITKIARNVRTYCALCARGQGLGTSEQDFLHVVRKNPGLSQAEVSGRLGIDKGAAARLAAKLEEKGYLRRQEDPRDKRLRRLYALPAADAVKETTAHREAAFYSWLARDIAPQELETFLRVLDTMYQKTKAESKTGFVSLLQEEAQHD